MSNQNLLGLAAKAAGLELDWDVPEGASPWVITGEGVERGPSAPWDPLEDDGDALRLAVQLSMFSGAKMFHFRSLERFGNPQASELECTRRAIVRTAAEIGESM